MIVGSKKALLLDTGLGIGDMKKLVSEITTLQLVVVNTHTHIDHVGGNYQFQEIYGMDTQFTRENAKGKSHEIMKEEVSAEAIWKPTPDGFSAESFISKPFSITKILHSGDQFDLGDRTLEVIFTPGHSPDSLCLIDRKNRFLFTGDTFYLAPIYVHVPGSDFDRFAQSAAMLAALRKDVDFLMPAHNETLLTSEYLLKLNQACLDIEAGKVSSVKNEGNRQYMFDGFSILVKPPESQ